ncbi:GlxA family transcriptional regulator [Lentzea aerocolonigenes]|uniref:GlxA family transcriptional regulator n=1 Tax=Lentzea aerocolonigenes TaxID=68170 RepID=UPI000697E5D9|nr:helix-turn-helix domain-containing protein [Lentzea aerocolonigenes]
MPTVAILALPNVIPLDLSIPAHVLGTQDGYDVSVCTEDLTGLKRADIVVVPGYENPERPPAEEYLDALSEAHDRGARMVAICTGTFALAATGLLDGRDATTHWKYLDSLRELHPLVKVHENRLFVEDGNLLTSAGAGAGIDACLHLIRADFGVVAAHEAGKDVVASPARDGAQPQYVDVLSPVRADLSPIRGWVMAHLGDAITVDVLAERSHLGRRTFIRHFERETGLSPMRWVMLQRILSARRLLETSDWSVDRIAAATGFGTGSNFRSVFRREVGTTPTAYRKVNSPNNDG